MTRVPKAEPSASLAGRKTVTRFLSQELRDVRLPKDFKGPRKIANYTIDMELAAWIESYELAMDMLEVPDGVFARYLTIMLDDPARTWL